MLTQGGKFRGIVVPGRGFGAPAMSQPQVQQAAKRISDLDVVPGTLNVRLSKPFDGVLKGYLTETELGGNVWSDQIPQRKGIKYAEVIIAGRYRGLIFQGDESEYPPTQVEIISDHKLRKVLNLRDGDPIEFTLVV